jgi:peptide/nickel transport system permease protein
MEGEIVRLADFFGRFGRSPAALAGSCLLGLLTLAILGRWLYPGDPWDFSAAPLIWPGTDWHHPLGSDSLGRDLALGMASGASVSLLIGVVSTVISASLGVIVGTLGGYYGGAIDGGLTRVTEVFQTVPAFLLVVVLVSVFSPSLPIIVFSIGIVSWPATARLARAQTLSLRETEFVLAGRVLGMGNLRLICTQILPNALPPIIVLAPLTIGTAIQTEAALSFMGLGDPAVMTWGKMIGDGRDQLLDAWYICGLPGFAIMVTVLAFNLLGEGLNDILNPRLWNR